MSKASSLKEKTVSFSISFKSECVEKVIFGAYLYAKQAILPPYIGSVFCFSTSSSKVSLDHQQG
jgi:hypothetical protein